MNQKFKVVCAIKTHGSPEMAKEDTRLETNVKKKEGQPNRISEEQMQRRNLREG